MKYKYLVWYILSLLVCTDSLTNVDVIQGLFMKYSVSTTCKSK